jgi:hypothetical protein
MHQKLVDPKRLQHLTKKSTSGGTLAEGDETDEKVSRQKPASTADDAPSVIGELQSAMFKVCSVGSSRNTR